MTATPASGCSTSCGPARSPAPTGRKVLARLGRASSRSGPGPARRAAAPRRPAAQLPGPRWVAVGAVAGRGAGVLCALAGLAGRPGDRRAKASGGHRQRNTIDIAGGRPPPWSRAPTWPGPCASSRCGSSSAGARCSTGSTRGDHSGSPRRRGDVEVTGTCFRVTLGAASDPVSDGHDGVGAGRLGEGTAARMGRRCRSRRARPCAWRRGSPGRGERNRVARAAQAAGAAGKGTAAARAAGRHRGPLAEAGGGSWPSSRRRWKSAPPAVGAAAADRRPGCASSATSWKA